MCGRDLHSAKLLSPKCTSVEKMTCRVPAASLGLKQAAGEVSPPVLSKAMTGLATHPTLAAAVLREHLGGKEDTWFQETFTEVI